jgi:hypothetical protein
VKREVLNIKEQKNILIKNVSRVRKKAERRAYGRQAVNGGATNLIDDQ